MKTFLVIGLGRFGSAVATELCTLGNEVLAMDIQEELVQAVAPDVTHAVTADARDPSVLKALGVHNYDCAIVATAEDVGSSALITLNLKELGMAEVICKARSHTHRKVLEKIGADRVIFPEHEMGVKLAQGLSSSNVLNFIEVSEDYGILEMAVPASWEGKSLRQVDVRKNYHVNIIAIRKSGEERELEITFGPDAPLEQGDILVAMGRSEDINRLHEVK